jgi:hypothetical protein
MLVPGVREAFSIIPLKPRLWGYSFAFAVFIIPLKFLFLLCKLPDPFNGEIPFQAVEGVPAGVYRYGKPFPDGCVIQPPPSIAADSTTPAHVATKSHSLRRPLRKLSSLSRLLSVPS